MYTEQMTQANAIVAKLDPVSQGTGTTTPMTDIDGSKYRRLLFILQIGSVGAAGTVDAKLRESKTAGGAYQDVAGAAITQVTTSNKIVTIEIRPEQLDPGYQYVQLSLTIGANAVLVGGVCLGGEAVEKPARANDIAAVTQRLVV